MPPTVSVIVINFNGERFLGQCLDSIFAQARPADEIVVVDNASDDQSLKCLQGYTDDRLTLIPLRTNVGYAGACNVGIRKSRGDLVALLNNDIVLDREWLRNLLRHRNGGWQFWASQILFESRRDVIDSAGDGMAVVGAGFKIGHGRNASNYLSPREVFGPCGAAALYTRRLLEETGGMDEDFFLIYEDADLSMRARLLGFRCLYVPEARVFHRVNTSIGTYSPAYVYYGHRNSEYVFWKNMPAALLFLYLPERILFNLASFLYFTSKGRGWSFLRAKRDFLSGFPYLWEKRRQVQETRRVTVREFRKLLDRNWLKYRRKGATLP